ncbi:MAG: hypothetical protein CMK89_12070 [Pseudomonadales bacterium]|nr:hypothetical protein [Pseudomonadales bacterium]
MKDLDWNDLHYFNAVAREGSLAKAAQALGVTHSTVFRRINQLEETLGVRLFDRLQEGYRLTDLGEEMLRYSDQVAATVDDLQRMLDNHNDELKGAIQVTAPHNFAYHYLPPLIAQFQALYPDIRIHLIASNADLNLSRREADLAIRATHTPPEHWVGQKLLSLGWAAYASPDYIARQGGSVTGLEHQQLILAEPNLQHIRAFQWADAQVHQGKGRHSKVVARCNDLMAMSALAVNGAGIALLPDDQFKPQLTRLFSLPAEFKSDIWVLMHPDLRGCKRLLLFKQFISEQLRQDPVLQNYGAVEQTTIFT